MTKREAVLISAYTGYLLVPHFTDVAEYCQKLLGRPIYTHEYADPDLQRELQDKLRPRIAELIRSLSDGRTHDTKDGDDRPAITLCRDCVYWEKRYINAKGFEICPTSGMDITQTDFCSYGVRKQTNNQQENKSE